MRKMNESAPESTQFKFEDEAMFSSETSLHLY
jgi:hypothetical protein